MEIRVKKVMGSIEFFKSLELAEFAENFGMEHLIAEKIALFARCGKNYQFFIADEPHFSLDFNIYYRYEMNGIYFFKQFSFGSCLSSAPFVQVISPLFFPEESKMMLEAGLIDEERMMRISQYGNMQIPKTPAGRAWIRERGASCTVMSL